MYRVVYKNKKKLVEKYRELFNSTHLETNWNALVAKPEMQFLPGILPRGYGLNDLLVADFDVLVDIYELFLGYLATLANDDERKRIKDLISSVLNFDNQRERIGRFLMGEISHLHHHCYYCDIVDISSYKDRLGRKQKYFQIEHVLDKGTCPLVALSLFNFVPSCPHCNTVLKGTGTIGETIADTRKLSPTTNRYDFYNKVHFVVNPLPGASVQEVSLEHEDEFEVDFDIRRGSEIYQHVIDTFNLKERYNEGEIKAEAIDIKNTMRLNPPERVHELAQQEHISDEEKYEQIFKVEWRKEHKYKTLKMYDDLLNYHL